MQHLRLCHQACPLAPDRCGTLCFCEVNHFLNLVAQEPRRGVTNGYIVFFDILRYLRISTSKPGRRIGAEKAGSSLCIPQQSMIYICHCYSNTVLTLLLQSHKAMPYLNRPYRHRKWYLEYLSRYIDPPEDSPPQTNFTVELAPFPTHFLENGQAVFTPSNRKDYLRVSQMDIRPDTVIFATGYTQCFDYLDKESNYPSPRDADLRNITRSGDENMAFIGYVRPGVGRLTDLNLRSKLTILQVQYLRLPRCRLSFGCLSLKAK